MTSSVKSESAQLAVLQPGTNVRTFFDRTWGSGDASCQALFLDVVLVEFEMDFIAGDVMSKYIIDSTR